MSCVLIRSRRAKTNISNHELMMLLMMSVFERMGGLIVNLCVIYTYNLVYTLKPTETG